MGTKKVDAMQSAQIVALQTDVGELRTKLNLLVQDAVAISTKLNVLINDLNDMNHVMMASWSSGIYYPVLSNAWIPAATHPWGVLKSLDIWKNLLEDHLVTQTARMVYSSTGYWNGSSWGPGYAVVIHSYWAVHAREYNGVAGPAAVSGYHNGQAPFTTIGYPLRIGAGGPRVFGYNPGGGSFAPPAGGGGSSSGGNTGTAGSYSAGVVGGTGQGTNSAHSADATTASVIAAYKNKEKLLEVSTTAKVIRAKKLVRNILNKLRSK